VLYQTAIFLFPIFAGVILLWFVRVFLRLRGAHRKPAAPAPPPDAQCLCGYELQGLDTIRCPECGRVTGFDATPEQLGLTAEQLRRAKQIRDARAIASNIPTPPANA